MASDEEIIDLSDSFLDDIALLITVPVQELYSFSIACQPISFKVTCTSATVLTTCSEVEISLGNIYKFLDDGTMPLPEKLLPRRGSWAKLRGTSCEMARCSSIERNNSLP
jgi:hypothetical protein